MKLLIKNIQSRGMGKEVNQAFFDGAIATIGRGTDQVIAIVDRRIPLKHSRIMEQNGKLQIKAEAGYGFSVNGNFVSQAPLSIGDDVDLLGHAIKILEGEQGAEFVVEVHVEAESVERMQDRFTTRVRQVDFPLRSLAWILFVGVLLIGLGIPAFGLFFGMKPLRDSPVLPGDGVWLSGALHPTHALIGNRCEVCHSQPFVAVRDNDCLQCHINVTQHFNPELRGRALGRRCENCHQEHNGASLILTRQNLCTDCHTNLAANGFKKNFLRPVTDFTSGHPAFRVSMEARDGNGKWQIIRRDLSDRHLEEHSNLKFPHDVHLARKGVKSPTGIVHLKCADCHQPEGGGHGMRPVAMEKDCARCHQLTFDPSSPNRVVPHGSPPALMRTLREYYAFEYVQRSQTPNAPPPPPTTQKWRDARMPGRHMESIGNMGPPHGVNVNFSAAAKAWISARVDRAAANLFEKQTCKICHEITYVRGDAVPWKVTPVKLTARWFPLAVFSHAAHKGMQCEDCHRARKSHVATDILMPNIDKCRACHGGEHSRNKLKSSCTTCHVFHMENQKPMAPPSLVQEAKNGLLPDIKHIAGK